MTSNTYKQDIERAFAIWRADLSSFEFPEEEAPAAFGMKRRNGWLRAIRETVCYSENLLSHRLRLTASGWANLERMELKGAITINQLELAAEALECEVVYFLRPRGRRHFSRIAFDQLLERAKELLAKRTCPPAMRCHALAVAAKQVYEDPEFRRENGWSRRKLSDAVPEALL